MSRAEEEYYVLDDYEDPPPGGEVLIVGTGERNYDDWDFWIGDPDTDWRDER